MPLQAVEVDVNAILELHANGVVAIAGLDDGDIVRRSNYGLREQKPRSKVLVVARRAHRDRNASRSPLTGVFKAETNLQRLLDGYAVLRRFAQIAAHFCDVDYLAAACHSDLFHLSGRPVYRSGAAYSPKRE